MNLVRYSMVCIVCAMVLVISGCTGSRVVVNTSSGLIIHAEDYTNLMNPDANKPKKELPKSTGNVIHLGNGYESIDLPPISR